MGKHKSFVTVQRSKSKRVTITKTVEVPLQKPGEDNFNYFIRLKKLGLKMPIKSRQPGS